MTGERDGERGRDDDVRDSDGDASEDDAGVSGAATDGSSAEEPLGSLRERVPDGDADGTPAAAFPTASSGDGADDEVAGDDGDGEEAPALDPAEDADRDGPLGELAADIDGRRERTSGVADELFDEVEVGEVDADELWTQVESDGPDVDVDGDRAIREVEKRKYCSGCPYFATPPDVHCSHEGTDIIEQVDMEQFKVADCPVVLEDERLEDVTTE